MGSLVNKLNKINETKKSIKQSLIDKGLTPTDEFDTYPELIRTIETKENLPELSDPATSSDMRNGKEAIDSNGTILRGNVNDVEVATPSISIDSNGLISASVEQEGGFVSSGNKSATKQIPLEEKTVTAGTDVSTILPTDGYYISKVTVNPTPTEEKTIIAGTEATTVVPTDGYHISKVTVNPVPLTEFGDAQAADVVIGKTFTSINGIKVNGALQKYDGAVVYSDLYKDNNYPVHYVADINLDYNFDKIVNAGTPIKTLFNARGFGDATAEDVVTGKIFTSSEGIMIPGTYEGIILPTVSNPATAAEIASGYETIDGAGNLLTGTGTIFDNNIVFDTANAEYITGHIDYDNTSLTISFSNYHDKIYAEIPLTTNADNRKYLYVYLLIIGNNVIITHAISSDSSALSISYSRYITLFGTNPFSVSRNGNKITITVKLSSVSLVRYITSVYKSTEKVTGIGNSNTGVNYYIMGA